MALISVEEAQVILLAQSIDRKTLWVPLENALGKVLAEPIYADRDYPPFNRASMDGYAFLFSDWEKGVVEFDIIETIYAGSSSTKHCFSGQCFKIMTGAATPDSADTIIRIEDTDFKERNTTVKFLVGPGKRGQHISKQGEDTNAQECVLKAFTRIRAEELGMLAVMGVSNVPIIKPPVVAILSTGNELVDVHKLPTATQIRDSNRYVLNAYLNEYGIEVTNSAIVADSIDELKQALMSAREVDIIVLSGGVSMGDADFVPEVLQALGVEKLIHKVAMKPGKPIWFGTWGKNRVFGLPGNPVSVKVTYQIFVHYFIKHWFGLDVKDGWLPFPMGENRIKKSSLDEFFPIRLEETAQGLVVFSVPSNGSGDVISMGKAKGIARQKASIDTLKKGNLVEVFLF